MIYNNDLTENLSTNVKISADDTSFFYDIHTSTNNLKKDLKKEVSGLLNGKLSLFQIVLNKLKKEFLAAKQKILDYYLIMPMLLGYVYRKQFKIILGNQLKFDYHLIVVSGKI